MNVHLLDDLLREYAGLGNLPSYVIEPSDGEKELKITARDAENMHAVIANALGLDSVNVLTPTQDVKAAEREQWDDGCNVLALSPGVVVAYERNVTTNTYPPQERDRGDHDPGMRAGSWPRWPTLHDLPHRAGAILTCPRTCTAGASSRKSTSHPLSGHKESIADTARVLGRMYDGIEHRGAAHENVELLAAHAGVPVRSGLTDSWHPTQSLCDTLTMREHSCKPDHDIAFAFVGNARDNVAHSLLVAGALLGMDVRMIAPPWLQVSDDVV